MSGCFRSGLPPAVRKPYICKPTDRRSSHTNTLNSPTASIWHHFFSPLYADSPHSPLLFNLIISHHFLFPAPFFPSSRGLSLLFLLSSPSASLLFLPFILLLFHSNSSYFLLPLSLFFGLLATPHPLSAFFSLLISVEDEWWKARRQSWDSNPMPRVWEPHCSWWEWES